jgi:hypothetical protein
MITPAHFTFTITSIAFLTSSMRDIMSRWVYDIGASDLQTEITLQDFEIGDVRQVWTYGWICIVLLSILAYVRNLAMFSFTFLIANLLIMLSIVIVSGYSIDMMLAEGVGPGTIPFNTAHMWGTVGFSIYIFEGIGVLMPIMQACECPEIFDKLFMYAATTLIFIFCSLGSLSYIAYGTMTK